METQNEKQQTKVLFEIHAKLLIDESRERKAPVYRDEIYLRVIHSKNEVVHRQMEPGDKERWPQEWARFQLTPEYKAFMAEPEERREFTPLTTIDRIGPATQRALEHRKIRSVEELAETDPEELSDIKGGDKLIQRARSALESRQAA